LVLRRTFALARRQTVFTACSPLRRPLSSHPGCRCASTPPSSGRSVAVCSGSPAVPPRGLQPRLQHVSHSSPPHWLETAAARRLRKHQTENRDRATLGGVGRP